MASEEVWKGPGGESMTLPKEYQGKKYALYLRRSQGETGDTKSQLQRIQSKVDQLEKSKKIKKLDRRIVGRDIDGKLKFKAERDLILQGDIFNEGNGQSGFKFEERPVLVELIRRVREGQYDGILVESMNRFARDFAGLSHLALPLWREEGKIIYDMNSGQTLDANRTNEAIINSQMTWGGIGKLEEIAKGKSALKGKIARGYLAGSTPEWIGAKSSGGKGQDYRKLWALGQAAGLNDRGNLNDPTNIARMFGKDSKWATLWYGKMLNYEELGVLDEWLDNIDMVNNFILEGGGQYPRRFFNQKPVKNLLDRTRGYFGYPAGVNLAKTNEFVVFPNPFGMLMELVKDDFDFPENFVQVRILKPSEISQLNFAQTQPRARGKLS